jgi:inosine triphosphate pyrophosphatase
MATRPSKTSGDGARPLFVTSSMDKLRECNEILGQEVDSHALKLEEIQSTSLEAVVRHKAEQAYRAIGKPLFVEDTALRFLAWGQLPGPFIKHFIENMGLLGLVDTLAPAKNWGAEAACGVGYHDGTQVHYFEARVRGTIVLPMGRGGFGFDPIFRPSDAGRTYGEMTPEEKNERSARALALKKLGVFLGLTPAQAPPAAQA